MNGKVRRFYEELAAMSGLRLDPEGGALYGTYKGYGVAVLAPNPSYPYQMCAVFSASRPDGPLTKEECKQFLKEHKAAADLSQNGWQITMIIRGAWDRSTSGRTLCSRWRIQPPTCAAPVSPTAASPAAR